MSEVEKKKFKIRDISFEHEGAHVALVHKDQGGPANQRYTLIHKSKATDDISEEELKQLLEKASGESERLGETEVEKAVESEIKTTLEKSLKEKFSDDELYLEDFDAESIVLSKSNGLFTVNYSLSDSGEYVVSGVLNQVPVALSKGVAVLGSSEQSVLSEGDKSLVSKALDNPETNERVVKHVSDSLEKAKIKMQEEIQKAVDAAVLQKQAELDAVKEELTKAQEVIAKVEAEKKEAVLKARQEAVAQFDKEGAEALVKATADLADEAFSTIVKSLKVKQEQLEQSDLFKQKSEQGSDAQQEQSATVEALKKLI